jgi:hypothetical protein
MYKIANNGSVYRILDGASIPADSKNSDYSEYLSWVDEGNTADDFEQDGIDRRSEIAERLAALDSEASALRIELNEL